ncbi:helix-turn-helix transcriptional regulator [Nocardia vaccinii]|uniref:helix-turn-helix transcriptional regulator n=1 Tax=Nocardia vaccinii TaxID=1822 RepID=UPI0008310BFE|nr:helix-turn-helix domain-containing protein [Nocardia vaccinii]
MDESEPTLSLQDIADLAQVKRPVVSTWRNRPSVRGELIPFPPPVPTAARGERFRREDVLEWLERTGRGNNDAHRLDAPGITVPEGVSLDDLVALLCLQVCTGSELAGSTSEQRIELAREADPHDHMLVSEITGLSATPAVLSYIDDLIESTFGPADALERLEASRAGRSLETRDLTPQALSVFRAIVHTCLNFPEPGAAQLVSSGDTPDLVLALADDEMYLSVVGTSAEARRLRRRATIRGTEVDSLTDSRRVRLASVVGAKTAEALDRVDDVLIDLEPGELAVVIGPSSALCDNLRGDLEQKRAATLRVIGLAMALRLPRGWWREAHRQALGVWIAVGGAKIEQPLVADLAAPTTGDLETDALAADIVEALARTRHRELRYARVHDRSAILAGHTVVPQGIAADRLRTSDSLQDIDRIHAATLVTSEIPGTLDVLVVPAAGALKVRNLSLGQLVEQKMLRVHRGSRIDAAHASPGSTVPVLSADHSSDGVTLDPLDAEKHYSRAVRTQPGDVIFMEKPPHARVDEVGGVLVASPSRVLRPNPEFGIGPRALAALINRQPEHCQEWKQWNVPMIDRGEASLLEDVLGRAEDYESELRKRLSASTDLCRALIDGIAAGTVSLHAPEKVLS